MAFGPGKYDEIATHARLAAKAQGVVLIVFGGEHGPGFSAQVPAEHLGLVVAVLRDMADQIERDTAS